MAETWNEYVASVRGWCDELKRRIAAERERAHPFLCRLVEEGAYEQERYCRMQLERALEPMHQELMRCITLLPPFVTSENGILVRHPITPENEHIFHELVDRPPPPERR